MLYLGFVFLNYSILIYKQFFGQTYISSGCYNCTALLPVISWFVYLCFNVSLNALNKPCWTPETFECMCVYIIWWIQMRHLSLIHPLPYISSFSLTHTLLPPLPPANRWHSADGPVSGEGLPTEGGSNAPGGDRTAPSSATGQTGQAWQEGQGRSRWALVTEADAHTHTCVKK